MPIHVIDTANQFRGKIVEIVLGSVVSEVEVETPWGKVASVITTRAVRELGLEIGSEVIAFVKVTDMAIAKVRDDSDLTECEGFRMPALHGRLPSRGGGAGV